MAETVRARVVVSGLVQGVGFRYSCMDEASARPVTGWVRNLRDGRVEAVFEGARADVEALVAWCREGPPSAEVSGADVRWEEPKGEKQFRILH